MDVVKGYQYNLFIWSYLFGSGAIIKWLDAAAPPPTTFKHSVKCKWSKLRSHLISTNINSDMKNETNSSDRIKITAAWH